LIDAFIPDLSGKFPPRTVILSPLRPEDGDMEVIISVLSVVKVWPELAGAACFLQPGNKQNVQTAQNRTTAKERVCFIYKFATIARGLQQFLFLCVNSWL
jgi:hypothetical protein